MMRQAPSTVSMMMMMMIMMPMPMCPLLWQSLLGFFLYLLCGRTNPCLGQSGYVSALSSLWPKASQALCHRKYRHTRSRQLPCPFRGVSGGSVFLSFWGWVSSWIRDTCPFLRCLMVSECSWECMPLKVPSSVSRAPPVRLKSVWLTVAACCLCTCLHGILRRALHPFAGGACWGGCSPWT